MLPDQNINKPVEEWENHSANENRVFSAQALLRERAERREGARGDFVLNS